MWRTSSRRRRGRRPAAKRSVNSTGARAPEHTFGQRVPVVGSGACPVSALELVGNGGNHAAACGVGQSKMKRLVLAMVVLFGLVAVSCTGSAAL
jgi:hypothetical protein